MKIKILICLTSLIIFSGCSKQQNQDVETVAPQIQPEGKIDGSVFLVTEGAYSIKLGLVTVALFNEEQITSALLKAATVIAETNLDTYDKNYSKRFSASLKDKSDSAYSDFTNDEANLIENWVKDTFYIYLNNIGAPIDTKKTDADGKFSFSIHKGSYLLAASAERKVMDKTEIYYWLVQVDFDGKTSKQVMLSNDNLIKTQSIHAIVPYAQSSPIRFCFGDSIVELSNPSYYGRDQVIFLKEKAK